MARYIYRLYLSLHFHNYANGWPHQRICGCGLHELTVLVLLIQMQLFSNIKWKIHCIIPSLETQCISLLMMKYATYHNGLNC